MAGPQRTCPTLKIEGTWRRSVLDWSELDGGHHREVLDWHRSLLALRKEYPELTSGSRERDLGVAYDEAARWLIVRRGRVVLACNFGAVAQTLDTSVVAPAVAGPGGRPARGTVGVILASSPDAAAHRLVLTVPGDSVVIGRLQ